MKVLLCISVLLVGVVGATAIATLSPESRSQSVVLPEARFLPNRTQLELEWSGGRTVIDASSLNVDVLDGVDCATAAIKPQQRLSGKSFFFGDQNHLSIDALTGNVAVAVVLQDCFEVFTSAVFVIDPQAPGAYTAHLVQIPGERSLPNASSTFPLDAIQRILYLDGDLLIRDGSAAVNTQDLFVFVPGSTPAMNYAGCVNTRLEEGRSRCPERRSD